MAYSKKDRDIICKDILKEIEEGLSLREAIKKIKQPNRNTFNDWLKEDEVLRDQYARAREAREEKIFDEILIIADETERDTITTEKGFEICNNEWVQRSRLKIEARKWILSKMNPKKFGDKTDVTSGGKELHGISTITVNIVNPLDDDDYE